MKGAVGNPRYLLRLSAAAAPMLAVASAANAQTLNEEDALIFYAMIVVVICLIFYMIPTIVAFCRTHPNRWLIAVVNITLGGTGLGWLGSLVWALSAVHRSPTGNHGGESGLNMFVNDTQRVVIEEPPDFDRTSEKLLRLKQLYEAGGLSLDEYQRLREPLIKLL